ncbi:MAG: cytochrome c [Bacteroidales bacterium]|nr:cytochrome c [Bacteroidales bacterium]
MMKHLIQSKKIAISVFILFVLSSSLNAQWNIPDDAKNMKTPAATYEAINIGKAIFAKDCLPCHGTPGKGNNNAGINATDLGAEEYQTKHNAGQMYYQFNTGMGIMPSFKDRFEEEDKWNIVFYVKSFDKDFKVTGEKPKTINADFILKTDESASKVFANVVTVNDKGDSIAAKDIGINFYVKRVFGNLQIGDAVSTNQVGTAVLSFPDDIAGDKDGKVVVFADFADPDTYGTKIKSVELNWAKPLHYKNPVLERSLWGPNNRVPMWLLLSYLFVTGGVWLTIFYVVFQIRRIKKAGQ